MATDTVWLDHGAWKHGLAACPSCGLPLDEGRDLIEYLQSLICEPFDYANPTNTAPALRAWPNSGRVKHTRCGAEFTFCFTDSAR